MLSQYCEYFTSVDPPRSGPLAASVYVNRAARAIFRFTPWRNNLVNLDTDREPGSFGVASNIGYAVILTFEWCGVFREERYDEIVIIVLQVPNQGSYPLSIDRFQRIQQHKGDYFVDLVSEVSRESEHQSSHLAFALREMVDGILLGSPVFGLADDVYLKDTIRHLLTALADLRLSMFKPHSLEIPVFEEFQHSIYVVVELL